MPAIYNLPRANNMWDQQEVDRYNKLPFYLAMQQAKFYPQWFVYNKLYGTIDWQPNMGSTMKGVVLEPSPIARQFFNPNPITQSPKKDIFSQYERTNQAVIRRHLFESPQFHFLPSFQDFRKKQIQSAQKDIGQQVTTADDQFARGYMFHYSPYVWVCGKLKDADGFELVSAPIGDPSDDGSTGKTTAWLQATVAKIGNTRDGGTMGLKNFAKLLSVFRNDIQAPAFEGMVNTPKDNETIKGNYVFVGDGEVYQNLTFDNHVLTYKDLNRDLLNNEFSGMILGKIVFKAERFPLRIDVDGTTPAPQSYVAGDANAFNLYETIPNSAYVNCPFGAGFMCGDAAYEKINVGPPPSEFAGGKISEEKFNKLFWNGEVRVTDNVLVNYGNNVLDTNKYGEYLQLISSVVHGIIPLNRRHFVPSIYRRWRVETT